MTQREAAEKVAKLKRLADDPRTPKPEAESAERQWRRLCDEHHLSADDLQERQLIAAFDELVESVEKIIKTHPRLPRGMFGAEAAIGHVLRHVRSLEEPAKKIRLKQIVTIVRAASYVAGTNTTVAEIKAAIETSLKNHDVII
jgi:hypothetical protein